MINRITIRDVASYDHEGVTFDNLSKVNFIYGGNGTGKTTLSRVLNTYNPNRDYEGHCMLEWDDTPVEVLAYNRDFKEGNLQESMPGVFLIGEQYIKTERNLDHWRQKRDECLRMEAIAYDFLREAKDELEKELERLQDILWEKLYIPYQGLKECLKEYGTGKVSFTERLAYLSRRHPSPFLNLNGVEEYNKLYKELFIDESDGPENPNASTLQMEREQLTNDLWQYLAILAQPDIEEYDKRKGPLVERYKEQYEFHEDAMRSLSQVDTSIKSTESMISSLKPAIDKVNSALRSYGFTCFSIQKSPKVHNHYQIQREDGSYVKNSLSEGEQTFITFLYYMQLVRGMVKDYNIDTRRVVVIDDPICSLDNEVLYVVHMMIRKLIDEVNEGKSNVQQVFVLTHNVYFHRMISWGCKDAHFWRLTKRGSVTRVADSGGESPVRSEYELQWQEIREAKQTGQVIGLPNTMRRIIETYFMVYGNYDKQKLFQENLADNEEERLIMASLAKWYDEGSHHVADDLYAGNTEELNEKYLRVFRQLFVRLGHEAHYNMMMREE